MERPLPQGLQIRRSRCGRSPWKGNERTIVSRGRRCWLSGWGAEEVTTEEAVSAPPPCLLYNALWVRRAGFHCARSMGRRNAEHATIRWELAARSVAATQHAGPPVRELGWLRKPALATDCHPDGTVPAVHL